MKKFLTAAEIARLENVSNMTATRWIRRGYFANARKVGRSYRIPLSEYHKWRESTKINPIKEQQNINVRTDVR
jgi:excisionase family DNA binding protein